MKLKKKDLGKYTDLSIFDVHIKRSDIDITYEVKKLKELIFWKKKKHL